jgi:hypothetical protein
MWDERITWAVLVAVLSTLLFSSIASGIIVTLLFALLFLKPSQAMPIVSTAGEPIPEGPASSSPNLQGTSLITSA